MRKILAIIVALIAGGFGMALVSTAPTVATAAPTSETGCSNSNHEEPGGGNNPFIHRCFEPDPGDVPSTQGPPVPNCQSTDSNPQFDPSNGCRIQTPPPAR
jgi:hypothetical protein